MTMANISTGKDCDDNYDDDHHDKDDYDDIDDDDDDKGDAITQHKVPQKKKNNYIFYILIKTRSRSDSFVLLKTYQQDGTHFSVTTNLKPSCRGMAESLSCSDTQSYTDVQTH